MAYIGIIIIFIILCMKILKIKTFEPAGIYSRVWIFFICGSVFFLKEQYIFRYAGIIWILISCGIFIFIARTSKHRTTDFDKDEVRYPTIYWKLLLLLVGLGMCSIVYTMLTTGINFGVFSDFALLQSTAHMSAVNRYSSGGEESSLVGQIFGAFIYISPICAGYSYIYAKEKKYKAICFSSIIPATLSMLLTSAKLSLVTYVILFFVGYYVSYLYLKKSVPTLKFKTIVWGGIVAVALYMLFYLSFVLRIGSGEHDLSRTIVTKLMIYAFGHVQGFDIWFDKYAWNLDDYGLGVNTFLAISSRLGMAEKRQGIYGLISGGCTNVYTQFRGLIEDYGPLFAMIVLVIILGSCHWMYLKLKDCRRPNTILQTLFAANMFWLLYFLVSAWTYTTYLLTFIVFGLYLYICFQIKFVYGRKGKYKK